MVFGRPTTPKPPLWRGRESTEFSTRLLEGKNERAHWSVTQLSVTMRRVAARSVSEQRQMENVGLHNQDAATCGGGGRVLIREVPDRRLAGGWNVEKVL
jgi:hypothetical protein